MPSVLTYPGVYIEEIPSGVRTITGVGTSITAFVGYTPRGPLNKAVRVLNFGDFERAFGGLHRDSDVSYALQQFFQNGGSDAYVVRVAAGAAAAAVNLNFPGGGAALTVRAADAGAWGNTLRLDVDYATSNPDSTFNLSVARVDPATLAVVERESFLNLSMSPRSATYAPAVVNAGSRLVRVDKAAGLAFDGADRGYSLSADVSAVTLASDETTLTGVVDGDTPFQIVIDLAGVTSLATLRTAISNAISAAALETRLDVERANANGAKNASTGKFLRLVSKSTSVAAENSSVTVTPAAANDASAALGFGAAAGGREKEGGAFRRPMPTGTTGTDLAATTTAVGGAISVAITDHPASGPVELLAAQPLTIPNTVPGQGLADAVQAQIRTLGHPAAQAAVVRYDGAALRVTLPEAYPNASVTIAGADANAMGLSGVGVSENVGRYALGVGTAFGGQAGAVVGADGTLPGAAEYIGSESAKTGIYALGDVDLFNILSIPGTSRLPDNQASDVIQKAITLAQAERAFFIIDPPAAQTLTTIEGWVANITKSRNAAVYFPRILASDPLDNFRLREMPASGAIAGVYARTDSERGVWKAPAGTEAVLRGTQGLAYNLTDLENGTLNPRGVNSLRSLPVYGRVVWGARTRAGADANADEYKYVPVRRLALYIEESLFRGSQWVVFEPNDEPLWSQIRLNAGAFMNNLFRQGAFQGKTPAQAYFVKCDSETTTQNDVDLGIVNIVVGFAPLKPAEFVIIKLQQKAGQIAA
ncbi:MAG TPA: phage tail sheath subtilisin-like domain-containing protein [Longimicrobium sp.]|nr:phage tail sheath subtilisin-like domain-containing protein [Longimicrobium sp.]